MRDIPSLYAVHLNGVLNSGEAQPISHCCMLPMARSASGTTGGTLWRRSLLGGSVRAGPRA